MTTLSFYQLFRLLRRHRELSEKRDPIYEANKAAKWLVGISFTFMIAYMLMFAVILAMGANESKTLTSPEFIMAALPVILLIDYWFRYISQQTPAQIVKPYVLLPIPRYTTVDCFILRSLFNWGNTIWFTILIPFCMMSVLFSYGLLTSLSIMLLYYIITLADSQFYSITRTLVINKMLWWILPISASVLLITPGLILGFDDFFIFYSNIGTGLENGNIIPHVVALVILIGLVEINRRVQYHSIWDELGKQKDTSPKTIHKLSFLERYGDMGEHLKLEVKSLLRNKNPRKSFISSIAVIVVISLLITFTEVYDTSFMTNFWCIYNFVIFAVMMLVKVMSFEGNYIDVLMVHKENILKLLTAKYYFYCGLLILPFILMLPMVFVGKWSILMLLSYGLFTAGFQHFTIMQLAVYNNKKIPLNEKFISKGGVDNNYIQMLEVIGTFIIPITLIQILETFLGTTYAWFTMMAIGVGFIAAHRLWLRNIYNRWMKRRYKNMESFHI
ncbi:MAG: DUF5687 family protein [Prevotella sp.]|nr:DUF5687 family protein [Prevotella sp.]